VGKFCGHICQGEFSSKQRFSQRLKENTKYEKSTRKYVLMIKGEKCEDCGITDWRGNKLSFNIDHVNGNRTDNRIENLRVLCPNCHSLTPTFGVKNVSEEGRKKMLAGAIKGNRIAISRKYAPSCSDG